MFNIQDEFQKYAVKHRGISSMTMHRYTSVLNDYITPNIIEDLLFNFMPLWMLFTAM